jgi:hypothetical protein
MRIHRLYARPLLFALIRTLAGSAIGLVIAFSCLVPGLLENYLDTLYVLSTVLGIGAAVGLLVGLAWGVASLPVGNSGGRNGTKAGG